MEYYNIITPEYLEALKSNIVYPKFKIEIMDFMENVIDDITQDISSQDSGSISINYQQGLRRSCSVTLINLSDSFKEKVGKYLPNPNGGIWITTKFKLYTGIAIPTSTVQKKEVQVSQNPVENLISQNSSQEEGQQNNNDYNIEYGNEAYNISQDIYWFSQGVYVLTNPSALRELSKQVITLNGVDKFGLFGSETNYNQTEGTYLIPAESTVGEVIKTILSFDKGNGTPIDIQEPYIDQSIYNQKIPFDIKKSPETYFADILVELGNIFACDVFYDTEGRLNFVKGNEERHMEEYAEIWQYTDETTEYFSPSVNYDFTNVYNSIKVIGNNPATSLFVYEARNEDPSSPTSIQKIGEKIKYIESSFCYDSERTKDFATYLLRKYSSMQNTLTFQSSIIPHLDVNKVITISDKHFNFVNQRFVIQSLTLPLSTQTLIDIEATNTANIPYFEY